MTDDNKEEKLSENHLCEVHEKELQERVDKMSKELSPMEFYNKAYEKGWDDAFGCGMDAELEELSEAAHSMGELYCHALGDLVEAVEEKYSEQSDSINDENNKISD